MCETMCEHQEHVIMWPSVQEQQNIAETFQSRYSMPGVVGVLDSTHICIPGPSDHRDSYINRKGHPSIQLQVTCDSSLLFTDVYTGWPGSVHDARVFRNSPLQAFLEGGISPSYHVLGDSAYPLTSYVLVPFVTFHPYRGTTIKYTLQLELTLNAQLVC